MLTMPRSDWQDQEMGSKTGFGIVTTRLCAQPGTAGTRMLVTNLTRCSLMAGGCSGTTAAINHLNKLAWSHRTAKTLVLRWHDAQQNACCHPIGVYCCCLRLFASSQLQPRARAPCILQPADFRHYFHSREFPDTTSAGETMLNA